MKKYRRDSVFSECCGILFFLLKNDIYHIKGDLHTMDRVESFQLDDIILDNHFALFFCNKRLIYSSSGVV